MVLGIGDFSSDQTDNPFLQHEPFGYNSDFIRLCFMSYVGKGLTLLFWIAAVYNVIAPQVSPLGAVLHWVAPVVLVIHSIEALFFSRRFASVGRKLPVSDIVQIVVFGGFHLMGLLKKEQAAGRINVSDRNSA